MNRVSRCRDIHSERRSLLKRRVVLLASCGPMRQQRLNELLCVMLEKVVPLRFCQNVKLTASESQLYIVSNTYFYIPIIELFYFIYDSLDIFVTTF